MEIDIVTTVDGILADILDCPLPIEESLSSENCEAWDSANCLNIVFAVEEQFNVRFSVDEIEHMTDRAGVISRLKRKLNSNP